MNAKNIKKMLEESRKTKFPRDVERLRKILEELEQQEKSNVIYKVGYWKAE